MNDNELYDNLHKRYTSCYFKQKDIPSKNLINTILKESLLITPMFSNLWHHRTDIYGPEYYDDKRAVCIQTVEHMGYRNMFNKKEDAKAGIEVLYNDLEIFEEAVKSGEVKKNGFGIFNEAVPFNTQVMAPYLLKFTYEPYTFGKTKPEELKPNSLAKHGMKLKAYQGAMAQAYAIAIIARKYGVDSSFCGCFIQNDDNKNKIWYNDDNLIKFMGLGYRDENCFDGPGSKHYNGKERPELKDNVVRWN